MKDLIEALTILAKYGDPYAPTQCGRDVLSVMVDPAMVSREDVARLGELSFVPDEEDVAFHSFRFGAAVSVGELVSYNHPSWGAVVGEVLRIDGEPGKILVQDRSPNGAREWWPLADCVRVDPV